MECSRMVSIGCGLVATLFLAFGCAEAEGARQGELSEGAGAAPSGEGSGGGGGGRDAVGQGSGSGGGGRDAVDDGVGNSGKVAVQDGHAALTFASFALACDEHPTFDYCREPYQFLVGVDIPAERLVPGRIELDDPDVSMFQLTGETSTEPTCFYVGGGEQGYLEILEVTATQVRARLDDGPGVEPDGFVFEMTRCEADELPADRGALVAKAADGLARMQFANHDMATCDDNYLEPFCPTPLDAVDITLSASRLVEGAVIDLADPQVAVRQSLQRGVGGTGTCEQIQDDLALSGTLTVVSVGASSLEVNVEGTGIELLDGAHDVTSCL